MDCTTAAIEEPAQDTSSSRSNSTGIQGEQCQPSTYSVHGIIRELAFDPYHEDSATDLTTISEFSKRFWEKSFTLFQYVCSPHRQCEECLNLVEGETLSE